LDLALFSILLGSLPNLGLQLDRQLWTATVLFLMNVKCLEEVQMLFAVPASEFSYAAKSRSRISQAGLQITFRLRI